MVYLDNFKDLIEFSYSYFHVLLLFLSLLKLSISLVEYKFSVVHLVLKNYF